MRQLMQKWTERHSGLMSIVFAIVVMFSLFIENKKLENDT